MFTHTFLVPDYYKDFVCKGGECRKTCCKGWGVSLSMREYYRLLGLNCSKKLRKSLDTSFYIADNPNNQRYALFRKKEDGDCPLRQKDGLCGLQKECGEGVLPSICRYYPRAIRAGYAYECCCSGSCEKVIEILMARQDKIRLKELTVSVDSENGMTFINDQLIRNLYTQIRRDCLDILQNREYQMPVRIRQIGDYIKALYCKNQKSGQAEFKEEKPNNGDFAEEFAIIKKTIIWFEENSVSLAEYADVVEGVLKDYAAYEDARNKFESLFPDWQIMIENMMVNHILYEKFPFSDYYKEYKEGYFSLCGAYLFLRYMAIGYTYIYPTAESLADVLAAAFRVIEHSGFDRNVAILLKGEGVTTFDRLGQLLEI